MVSHTPHLHMCISHTRVHTTHILHVPRIHMPHVEQMLIYTVCKHTYTRVPQTTRATYTPNTHTYTHHTCHTPHTEHLCHTQIIQAIQRHVHNPHTLPHTYT